MLSFAGFGCVNDCEPNEKLNVDDPKADELAEIVVCGDVVQPLKLPKLNVDFEGAAETEKFNSIQSTSYHQYLVLNLPFEDPKAF